MTVQATFAATLADEWARCGLSHAVVSPGSRSTPLVVALAAHPDIEVHVRLDERSAAFFALGIGLATGRPAVLVTTSGTAAAEVHAAVVEAHHACVPLVVCSADRPPELRDVGAPQTIDQRALYGSALRSSVDPGVPSDEARGSWRPLAARIAATAMSHPAGAGPVHVNLPFREPLLGEAGELPVARPGREPWLAVAGRVGAPDSGFLAQLAGVVAGGPRGVILAGDGCDDLAALYALAAALGWPLLADPRARPRTPAPELVCCADLLLRDERFAAAHLPEVVLCLGAPPASRVVAGWLAAANAATHVVCEDRWPWHDPDGSATHVVAASPDATARALRELVVAGGGGTAPEDWLHGWQQAEQTAQRAVDEVLGRDGELTEPKLARAVYAALPPGSTLVASSSMPVRDLEWFAAPRTDPPRLLANRGANGIDGITSTALGVAAASRAGSVTAITGDLAFLHDLSALVWSDDEEVPAATVVVVDNHGGGIFSFLPQAGQMPARLFERLLATPQRAAIADVARVLGCEVEEAASTGELESILTRPPSGLRVVVVRTDRVQNVAAHAELSAAVAAALAVHPAEAAEAGGGPAGG